MFDLSNDTNWWLPCISLNWDNRSPHATASFAVKMPLLNVDGHEVARGQRKMQLELLGWFDGGWCTYGMFLNKTSMDKNSHSFNIDIPIILGLYPLRWPFGYLLRRGRLSWPLGMIATDIPEGSILATYRIQSGSFGYIQIYVLFSLWNIWIIELTSVHVRGSSVFPSQLINYTF